MHLADAVWRDGARARARACTHTPARAMARAGCVSNLLRAAEAAPPRHQRVRGDRRVCAYTCTNSCTRERVPPFVRRRPPAVTAGGLPPPAAGRSRAHPDPPAHANTSRLRGQVQSMRSQSADEYRLRRSIQLNTVARTFCRRVSKQKQSSRILSDASDFGTCLAVGNVRSR